MVNRFELTAVNRHDRLSKQIQTPTNPHEFSTHAAQRFAVHLAKLPDRLVIRRQSMREPHPFNIALAFAFKSAG